MPRARPYAVPYALPYAVTRRRARPGRCRAAQREYAYDRTARSGKLDKGLEEANVKGWLIVDVKDDWRTVFKGETVGATGSK